MPETPNAMPVPIEGVEDAGLLARAIVDTIHEPLLVLDAELRVLAASRAFYSVFQSQADLTLGRLLYDLGDGQWNIPALRLLLETVIPQRTAMDGFEVESDFPGVGRRIMLLNARKVHDDANTATPISGSCQWRRCSPSCTRPEGSIRSRSVPIWPNSAKSWRVHDPGRPADHHSGRGG